MEGKSKITNVEYLQDSYGRVHNYLRLSITDRCNLRCSYCMPADSTFMPANKLLSVEEIDSLCAVFISMGVNKIRLTGGEALARIEFPEIVNRLTRHNIPLFLTTNGTLLHNHLDLIANTFSRVNISLDTLRKERFNSINQRNAFQRTLENIRLAISNNITIKINMVVIRGSNHDEIPDFVKLTLKYPLEIRFIEFMPFRDNKWTRMKNYSFQEILDMILSNFEVQKLKKEDTATADMFRVKNAPGRFGIIATVSHPFCNACNRIRITADGKIKNCLFGPKEYDLRPAMPDEEQLKEIIRTALQEKHFQHGGNSLLNYGGESNNSDWNRSMASIGG